MSKRIFITAGGSSHRLTRIEGIPKALTQLPDGQIVLDRLLAPIPDEYDITICKGFRDDLIDVQYGGLDSIKTYDPEAPVGILSCIKQVLTEYDEDVYIFLLGDTVWHPEAFSEALRCAESGDIVGYGERPKSPCETYMYTISGAGIDLMKELLSRPLFEFKIPSKNNRPSTTRGLEPFTLQQGKIWLLERWMKRDLGRNWMRSVVRYMRSHPATDFDTDAQYDRVWKEYEAGEYGTVDGGGYYGRPITQPKED